MCTGLRLTCADGTVVHGRTVEFAVHLQMDVLHVPVGTPFTSTLSNGTGARWTARHSVIGVACQGADAVMDGINDAGLSAGAFYFPGTASYTPDDGDSDAVAPQDLVHWLLTNCSSLHEVRTRIDDIRVVAANAPAWGGVPPFHWIAYDPDGRAIAIEPVDGELRITDNPFGSFANSPEFDFHLKNLAQYMEVTPTSTMTSELGGTPITGFGTGSGSLGLPGDFTSPSRFVRATMFSANHETPADAGDGIGEVFHLLNQFDVPRGFVTVNENGTDCIEWTLGTVARDPAAREYYFRSYGDQSLRKVGLAKLDQATTGPSRIPFGPDVGSSTTVADLSDELVQA